VIESGDYHGLPTIRLASPYLWLEVLATAGPRIVRLGLAGDPTNALAETPGMGWQTPHGRYELFGGHRLWFAPEDPERVAIPDDEGLAIEREPAGLRLIGRTEPGTGLARTIAVHLSATGPAATVRHELANRGDAPIELAPWSITQLPLGGRVILPQRPAVRGHAVRPNRAFVLWPYTSWDDPRLTLRDGVVVVDAVGAGALKVGFFNDAGWVAYERDGTTLVRRFRPAAGRPHSDMGCNVETYCGARYVELEILGPLTRLGPGETTVLTEHWELRLRPDRLLEADPTALVGRLAMPLAEMAAEPA
jgi:hypothetical protein